MCCFSDILSNFFRALSRYVVFDTSFFIFFEIDRFKVRGGGSGGDKTFSDKSDDSWDVLLTAEINVAYVLMKKSYSAEWTRLMLNFQKQNLTEIRYLFQ